MKPEPSSGRRAEPSSGARCRSTRETPCRLRSRPSMTSPVPAGIAVDHDVLRVRVVDDEHAVDRDGDARRRAATSCSTSVPVGVVGSRRDTGRVRRARTRAPDQRSRPCRTSFTTASRRTLATSHRVARHTFRASWPASTSTTRSSRPATCSPRSAGACARIRPANPDAQGHPARHRRRHRAARAGDRRGDARGRRRDGAARDVPRLRPRAGLRLPRRGDPRARLRGARRRDRRRRDLRLRRQQVRQRQHPGDLRARRARSRSPIRSIRSTSTRT